MRTLLFAMLSLTVLFESIYAMEKQRGTGQPNTRRNNQARPYRPQAQVATPAAQPVLAAVEEVQQVLPQRKVEVITCPSQTSDEHIQNSPSEPSQPGPSVQSATANSERVVEQPKSVTAETPAPAAPAAIVEAKKTDAKVDDEGFKNSISSMTKMWHARSDHMTFALTLLANREGTKKEVGHQIDRAIEWVTEQLSEIAKSGDHNSLQALQLIIEQQKPHIENLRKLIKLTSENKVQFLEKSSRMAWCEAIKKHNDLRIALTALICKENAQALHDNKETGKLIRTIKYEKQELDGEISDEEYDDMSGLFNKVETVLARQAREAQAAKK